MVLLQDLIIHTGAVIIPFRKSTGHNLHQVLVTKIILGQKNQMVVAVLPLAKFPIETGTRGNVDLTSQNRFDPDLFCLLIKINHAVHHAMVRDGKTVHPKFFRPGKKLLNLAGTIQQTVFCMYMQMGKCHTGPPLI